MGVGAVVISLVFVDVQLRETTRATRAAAASAVSTATSEWYWNLGCSAQASAVALTFLTGPERLSKEEQYQAMMLFHGVLLLFQNSHYLSKQRALDSTIHNTVLEAIVAVKTTPGWALYWKERRGYFHPAFQAYIESLISTDRTVSEGIYQRAAEAAGQ